MKKTNKKSSPKPDKFPINFRIITDYLTKPIYWPVEGVIILFLLVSFLFMVIILSAGTILYLDKQNILQTKHEDIQSKVEFWEGIVRKYPDYRDAYFSLSLLEYQRGNTQKARVYLQEALSLDPNFKEGRALEKVLK